MKSGLSLQLKPKKVHSVHFTNQIKCTTNTLNKHDEDEGWCSNVHCVTLQEAQTSHTKQAEWKLGFVLQTHIFLPHSDKYVRNSKLTQNFLFLLLFFLIREWILKYSINWCHAIIIGLATTPTDWLFDRTEYSNNLYDFARRLISRHAAGFGHCYWRFFRSVCFVCCVMARCDRVYKTTAKRHQSNSGANTQPSSSKWHCQASLLRGEESREAVMNCVLSRVILWMGCQFIK